MKENKSSLSKLRNFDQSIDLVLAQWLSNQLGKGKLKHNCLYMGLLIVFSAFALLIYFYLLFNPSKLSKLLLSLAYIYAFIAFLVITYPGYRFDDSNIFQMKQNVYSEVKNIPFEKLDKYFDLVLYGFDRITKKDDQIIKFIYSLITVALTVLRAIIPSSTSSSTLYNIFSNSLEKNINVIILSIVYIVICVGCWVFYMSKINRLVASRVHLFLYSVLEHKILNEFE